MAKHGIFLLLLSSVPVPNCVAEECDVIFKADVFTHSKSKTRPLRIKMRQNSSNSPCNLTVILPDYKTLSFQVNNSEISQFSGGLTGPSHLKQTVSLQRKRSDMVWLEISSRNSSDEATDTRSGLYRISGKRIFAFQTPSEENVLSQVENIKCQGNLNLVKKLDIPPSRVSSEETTTPTMQVEGSVKLTNMFQLCRKYNQLFNHTQTQYLKYDVGKVIFGQDNLNFIITINETFMEDIEIQCDVKGGDGVKEYKIKFTPDLSECQENPEVPLNNANIIIAIAVSVAVFVAIVAVVSVIIWRKRRGISHPHHSLLSLQERELNQLTNQENQETQEL